MPPPPPQATAVRVVLQRDASGSLVARPEGREPVADVRVVRAFPWSLPDGPVSLLDRNGSEVAWFDSLDALDPASRALAAEELRDKVFRPRIARLAAVREEFGVLAFTAETDRGRVTFEVRSREDVRHLSDTRLVLRDADGNVYEVADTAGLDPRSRRLLESVA